MKKTKDHLGQKIKRLRAFRGMRQEDLASRIGKTRSLISFIERTGIMNKYTQKEIASVLDCHPEEFELLAPILNNNAEEKKHVGAEEKLVYETLIKELKEEISYLKTVIKEQMDLIKAFKKNK